MRFREYRHTDPVRVEVVIEHLAHFVQCTVHPSAASRQAAIGITQSATKFPGKPLAKPSSLPTKSSLGLLHFLLTLNFYFRLGHVQGSPRGSHKLYSISVVLSTDPAQNRRYNLGSNCMPFWPLTGPRPGHVKHKVTPATRSLFSGSPRPNVCEFPRNRPG